MEETIFNADQANQNEAPASTEGAANTPTFTIPTEVVELVGDGKKYKSAEDALKSVPHAQKHIQTLEEENKRLKEELTKRQAAEEVLNEIKQFSMPKVETPSQGVEADPEVLSQLVEQVLEKKNLQAKLETNAQIVTSKFTEAYGEKAESVYNELCKKHGMTIATMNQLATTSPAAVLALAGINNSVPTSSGKIQSSVIAPLTNGKNELSAKLPKYATTKQTMEAFSNARKIVMNQLNNQGK